MQLKRISILSSAALLAISLFSCGGNQTQNDTGTDTTKVIKDSAEDAKQTETIDVAALGKTQGVTVSGIVDNYTYVDLGLKSGVKWATFNVGATKPTECGAYFAWGETKPKSDYGWDTYKWTDDGGISFTKYTTDGMTKLDPSDDAATQNWGSGWRMPTHDEQMELLDGCTWTWTENFEGSGMAGHIGKSKKNGNVIFLPAADFFCGTGLDTDECGGYYWSSSLEDSGSAYAYYFLFNSEGVGWDDKIRYTGESVRAVVQ